MRVLDGRYGPYVKHGRTNASLPKDRVPETITMAEAVELLAGREASGKAKGRGKSAAAKPSAKKAAPKAKGATKSKPSASGKGGAKKK